MAANTHPDHDTLATFRRRFLKEVELLFVQVLVLAREMKLLKLGHIALDGTKIDANASKHRALSWGHAHKIEAQLRQEVQALLALAENRDRADIPDGMDVPAEIARREDRLSAMALAKAKISSAPPSVISANSRSTRPRRLNASLRGMPARSRAARIPSRQRLAPRTVTR